MKPAPPVAAYRIIVSEALEDAATGVLWELGTHGIEVLRAAEGEAALLAYFPETLPLEHVRAQLASLFASVERASVPEVDWVARFRETFRGFSVGRFRVAPPWDFPQGLRGDERVLLVDPGRAFGTGTHETTRLCLAELEAVFATGDGAPQRVLDVGTGTGILALAAARLGATRVVGVDNDPEALAAARHHARLNGLDLHLVLGDGAEAFRAGSFDLVLANITAPVLRARAVSIASLVARGGALVLAGLLTEEARRVRDAYARLGPGAERREGEWSALRFTAP